MKIFVKRADTEKELEDVFKIRYRVYCIERGYEDPKLHYYGKEIDEYDPYSIHFIAYEGLYPAGTSRLILPNPIGLPIEKYCHINAKNVCGMNNFVEISRLAVSSEIMRHALSDKFMVTLALFREMYHTGRSLNVGCFFAAMSAGLVRLLNSYGLTFRKAGQPVDYHGIRTPYFGYIDDINRMIFNAQNSTEPQIIDNRAVV